jgi:acyl dehydratase
MDLRRQLPLPPGYTNVRNAGSETEWIAPVYLGEQLFARSCIVDIIAREGRAGLGIYITQEEQVLNSDEQIVLRRRHTLAIFPDKTYPERAEEHK